MASLRDFTLFLSAPIIDFEFFNIKYSKFAEKFFVMKFSAVQNRFFCHHRWKRECQGKISVRNGNIFTNWQKFTQFLAGLFRIFSSLSDRQIAII